MSGSLRWAQLHPGQMVNEINFKFYKDLKGIEIILVPCDVIILNKLNKIVKTNLLMLLAEISTLLHYFI